VGIGLLNIRPVTKQIILLYLMVSRLPGRDNDWRYGGVGNLIVDDTLLESMHHSKRN
jgi:hypothetical protein